MSARRSGLALAALAAVPFLPALVGARALFQRDVVSYWLPMVEVFVRQVNAGAWPLWNSGVGFGAPLWADPNFQWAYPTTWLNLLLPPAIGFAVMVASHAVLGALGARRLAVAAGASPAAAFFAGAAFAWSGPWLSSATLWHHYCTVAWAPWVLLALERLAAAPGARRVAGLGAAAGMAALAGSADACLMVLLLALARLPALFAASRAPRSLLAGLLASAALAAGLAAAQWLPTAHIVAAGVRGALPESARLYWSLHPASLVDLGVPRLLAAVPWTNGARDLLYEGREPLIDGIYLGASVLVLAAVGLAAAERRRLAWGLAAAALLLIGLALGRHAPLSPLLAAPGFAQLRYPGKFLWLVPLLVGLLAVLGLQAVESARAASAAITRVASAGLAVSTLLLLSAVVTWLRSGLWLPWVATGVDPQWVASGAALALLHAGLAAGLVAGLVRAAAAQPVAARPLRWIVAATLVDLALFALPQNPMGPPELFRHEPPVVAALRRERAARVLVRRGERRLEDQLRYGPVGWQPEPRFVLGVQELLSPPAAARWGLAGSFDGDFTGLAPRPTSALSRLAGGHGAELARSRLLQVAGVSHVVTLESHPPLAGATEVAAFPSVFAEPVRLFRLSPPLPYARLVCGVRRVDEAGALGRIVDMASDVLRETGSPDLPERRCEHGSSARIKLLGRTPASASYEVTASHGAVLVELGAVYPGWSVTVDEAPATLGTADILFRAVEVPAGRHVVTFAYEPPGLRAGLALAAVAAVLLALAARAPRPRPGC
ncbi:MAG: YfhO family protein [Vicinamibacteria bacterium]|nr:YfhO family protein [Vicinamibacteria bacterium]